jgi:transcriptional regulator with XRE-family HTH domain
MPHDATHDPIDLYAGARLRQRRITADLSQQDLAAAAGVTFQQIQKYERGANRISVSMLHRMAGALGVPPAYFFPAADAELPQIMPDPIEERAQEIYDASRRRIKVRPRWERLSETDPFDHAMRAKALELAQAAIDLEADDAPHGRALSAR